jgi:hypothetical protein
MFASPMKSPVRRVPATADFYANAESRSPYWQDAKVVLAIASPYRNRRARTGPGASQSSADGEPFGSEPVAGS